MSLRQQVMQVLKHYGPGAHPDGSPQSVHGGDTAGGAGPLTDLQWNRLKSQWVNLASLRLTLHGQIQRKKRFGQATYAENSVRDALAASRMAWTNSIRRKPGGHGNS